MLDSRGFNETMCWVQEVSLWLRKKGCRLNLRPLGEKQLLAWLPVCFLMLWAVQRLLVLSLFALVRAVVSSG